MAGLVAAAAPTGPQLVLASDRLANSNLIRMASIQWRRVCVSATASPSETFLPRRLTAFFRLRCCLLASRRSSVVIMTLSLIAHEGAVQCSTALVQFHFFFHSSAVLLLLSSRASSAAAAAAAADVVCRFDMTAALGSSSRSYKTHTQKEPPLRFQLIRTLSTG